MSYQMHSKESLLSFVNAANVLGGVNVLSVPNIDFSLPKVIVGSWRERVTAKNTAIRLTAKESAPYEGSQVILYDRLNLANLVHIGGFKVAGIDPVTTHDTFDSIAFYTGIKFLPEDLEDLPVVYAQDGKATVMLSAKPNSIGWVGNLSVQMVAGGVSLPATVLVADLPGLNYPAPLPGVDIMGSVYLYGYDFTPYVATLLDIDENILTQDHADTLAIALQEIDVSSGKLGWNSNINSGSWSLSEATVVYNGLNSNTMPTNPSYKYVLALQLRANVATPTGVLYLHYNDPFDPNNF